jgi:hypothetical protein
MKFVSFAQKNQVNLTGKMMINPTQSIDRYKIQADKKAQQGLCKENLTPKIRIKCCNLSSHVHGKGLENVEIYK